MHFRLQDATSTPKENPLKTCRKPGDGRVLVCRNYNVWADKGELDFIQRYVNDPKQMTRSLLSIIVGKQNLKNMCARGKSGERRGVPKDIINCVECKLYSFIFYMCIITFL